MDANFGIGTLATVLDPNVLHNKLTVQRIR
jgi:hypothetical protein